MKQINFGCGAHAPPGWLNVDGSLRVWLEQIPCVHWFGLKRRFPRNVRRMRVGGRLPFSDHSASLIYSSHMVEHLHRTEADLFFKECFRILQPGGRVRIMVPSLRQIIGDYTKHAQADRLMRDLLMTSEEPHGGLLGSFLASLRQKNWHQWMYDEHSLASRLTTCGFHGVTVKENWVTDFPDLGELEPSSMRAGSICAEARKP